MPDESLKRLLKRDGVLLARDGAISTEDGSVVEAPPGNCCCCECLHIMVLPMYFGYHASERDTDPCYGWNVYEVLKQRLEAAGYTVTLNEKLCNPDEEDWYCVDVFITCECCLSCHTDFIGSAPHLHPSPEYIFPNDSLAWVDVSVLIPECTMGNTFFLYRFTGCCNRYPPLSGFPLPMWYVVPDADDMKIYLPACNPSADWCNPFP